MTTPGPPVTPGPPTPVAPPTTPGQVAAYMLYQQQLKEYQHPRPPVTPPVQPQNPPQQSVHPDWVNPCAECGAAVQEPCLGPNGYALGYLHAPRLMLKPPPAPPVSLIPTPPNVFNKNGL